MYSEELKPRVGLITLTDVPRALLGAKVREDAITKKHIDYKNFLLANGIEVFDAADYVERQSGWVSFYSSEDIGRALDIFLQKEVIKNVGHHKNFMMENHTFKYLKSKEYMDYTVSNRDIYENWIKKRKSINY